MIKLTVGAILGGWPVILSSIIIAVLAITVLPCPPRRWWKIVFPVSLGLCLASGIAEAYAIMHPINNILIRDAITVVLLSGASVLLSAVATRALYRFSLLSAVLASLVVSLGITLAMPLLLLLVHCTSGDCL